MRFFAIILVCCLSQFTASSQGFSNKGREFWLTFPAHTDSLTAVMGIYLTSDMAASGTVTVGSSSIPFSIQPNAVKRVFIGAGAGNDADNTNVYMTLDDNIKPNAGIHVVADNPVIVYGHIIRKARSAASLILPTNVWGKNYLVPSYPNFRNATPGTTSSGRGNITIVAKYANTLVEIIPKTTNLSGSRPAETPYTITLAKPGDVYQVQYKKDEDISGTIVRSMALAGEPCKPIAVFSGTTWSAFGCTSPDGRIPTGGDNLYQQLFPTGTFGKSFLTAPFINRKYDIVRVFVTDASTTVTKFENGISTTLTGLQRNSFYEFTTNQPTKIDADKPISVVQYMISQSCTPNASVGDPEMVILSPIEQTINNITVFSAHKDFVPAGQSNVNQCFLNVIIKSKAAASFQINGSKPVGNFVNILGTAYSYLQEDLSTIAATNPVQHMSADSNFSAIAYGYGLTESYGYNAGTNVKDLNQYISIKNQKNTVNFPAACANAPFYFSITVPNQANTIEWDFHGNFANIIQNAPQPDSSYVENNTTYYRYPLPNVFDYVAAGNYPVSVSIKNVNGDGCDAEVKTEYEVIVSPKPKANFTWQNTGCVGDVINFTDAASGNGRTIHKWEWNFGDNTSDFTQNPVKKYNQPGTYTIKQTIITDIGCAADTTQTIHLSPKPVASFSISMPYCSGSLLVFNDASTISNGKIERRFWNFGNGQKDTIANDLPPKITYTQAGKYTVGLQSESETGCLSLPVNKEIDITTGPIVSFDKPNAACLPLASASFINKTTIADGTLAQVKYNWNFGDGGTSTATNPTHIFTKTGNFSVKLTASSSSGCVSSLTDEFSEIFNQPKADFSILKNGCLGDSSRFTDRSIAENQSIISYEWLFGDGNKSTLLNAANKYSSTSLYTVKHWVKSEKGCQSDTAIKTIKISSKPTANFRYGALCQNQPINFTDESIANDGNIKTRYWQFSNGVTKEVDNGNTFQETFTNVEEITAKLSVATESGCKSDTVVKTLQLNKMPVAGFTMPEVCLADAYAQFTDTSKNADGNNSGLQWHWNFGDADNVATNTSTVQNARHTYSKVANYVVNLIVTSKEGCTNTSSQNFAINGSSPKANFSFLNNSGTCSNEKVVIKNGSTVNFGKITKIEIFWQWPSATEKTTDQEPSDGKLYEYNYPVFQNPATKTYSIRYLAYSGGVCVDEVTKSVTLHASPQISFSAIPSICFEATPRQITQASANLPGTGVFSGSGISASGIFNPKIAGQGTHIIKYIYSIPQGCKDSATQTVTVWPMPTAHYTVVNAACQNKPITFKDNSTAGAGNIVNWHWQYADDSTEDRTNSSNFEKTFDNAANTNVGLVVTTDSGCTSSIYTSNITFYPLPKAKFELPETVCLPTGRAVFTNLSTISDDSKPQLSYLWHLGINNATSTEENAIYNYSAKDNYTIILVTTSKKGCADSNQQILSNITTQPLANFRATPEEICVDGLVNFTNLSNALGETIANWNWNFKDGNTGNSKDTSYLYKTAGTYKVAMFYTIANGCHSDTAVQKVVIHPKPLVFAGGEIAVIVGNTRIIPARVSGGSNYIYKWQPDTWLSNTAILNPVTSAMANITYSLKVTSLGGCADSATVLVHYALAPVIPNAFSPNGDGINDVWAIKYLESYDGATVDVFDRYGRQVFSTIGYKTPWDGKYKGAQLPTGVYYYIIDPKNKKQKINGSITILH